MNNFRASQMIVAACAKLESSCLVSFKTIAPECCLKKETHQSLRSAETDVTMVAISIIVLRCLLFSPQNNDITVHQSYDFERIVR